MVWQFPRLENKKKKDKASENKGET